MNDIAEDARAESLLSGSVFRNGRCTKKEKRKSAIFGVEWVTWSEYVTISDSVINVRVRTYTNYGSNNERFCFQKTILASIEW